MSHKKLRPFIVKVSVLGNFPLIDTCSYTCILVNYKSINMSNTEPLLLLLTP